MYAAMVYASLITLIAPWTLVWHDEFDHNGPPNPKKWTYDVGYIANHEKQFYVANRPENARVENGKLIIEARKDGFDGHEITSARLKTQGKASWKYGRFEARVKVPTGIGTWPAFWTLGDRIDTIGWPKCGEIDIMENVGFEPAKAVFTVHSIGKNPQLETHAQSGKSVVAPKLWEAFHTYAIEWSTDRIEWFFDGASVFTFDKVNTTEAKWVFDQPHFILLNLAIGGDWGGQHGIDPSIFPARYEIDYVRVYQR